MMNQKFEQKIGFIGQGWIGRNYAKDFQKRGYNVICYDLSPEYIINKEEIKKCDIVFIAVPTPTTPKGYDDSIVREAVSLVGEGKIAVIKSTMFPGSTEKLQKKYPAVFVFNSPEFLSTSTAEHDASHPNRNIIGMPISNEIYKEKALRVLSILPQAPYEKICTSREAEIIKYSRNILGYARVIFSNILYDATMSLEADWYPIQEAVSSDPDNGHTYANPIHKSGRGAGGGCFIKDFEAFIQFYKKKCARR